MKDILQRSMRAGLILSLAALGVACGSDNLYQLKNQNAASSTDAEVKIIAGMSLTELKDFNITLSEYYALKNDMSQQFTFFSHCKEINADKLLCALTDKEGTDAKVMGMETVLSEKMYQALPDAEKANFHAHKAEVASGRLIAKGEGDLKAFLDKLAASFGKAELFMMPGSDKALPEALILTTASEGSLGIMGSGQGQGSGSSDKANQASGGKSAVQNATPTTPAEPKEPQKPTEPTKGQEPVAKKPVQMSAMQEPMKAQGQAPAPQEPTKSETPKEPAKEPAKATSQQPLKVASQEPMKATSQEPMKAAPAPAQAQGATTTTTGEKPAVQSPAQGSLKATPPAKEEPTKPQAPEAPSKEAPAKVATQQ